MPENVDYDEIFTHLAPNADNLLYMRYLFAPRKARYLFWHGVTCRGWGITKWGEIQLFSPGYPAQVELQSAFINLGEVVGDGRPKVIKALHWDADLPPSTRMQLRSRSGNALAPVFTFRNKLGEEITEEKWKSSPKVLRGPIDTTLVVGEDWDAWSNVYQFSGETFKSASPRRFMLLEMILSTDDPAIAPTVNSVSVEFEDALVQGAHGSVTPREASPNQDTHFTYTLWPEADELDSGFDLMRFTVPEPVDLQSVSVMVGAEQVVPATLAMQADSLLIALPQVISGDSLQVSFTTRLLQNATVFALDLGSSAAPGLWQSVEAAERRSNIVMLPRTDQQQPAHQRPATGLCDHNPQRRRHQRPARSPIRRLQSRGHGTAGGNFRPSRTPSSNSHPKHRRLATPLHLGWPRPQRNEHRPRPVRPAR